MAGAETDGRGKSYRQRVMHYVKGTLVGAFLVAVAWLLAFGPRGTNLPPEANGRTVITYWEKWTGREGDQMGYIVKDFNATVGKEKNIYVQYLTVSHIEQKTLVATAGGVPPDVAGIWDTQLVQFAALESLEPLDELARLHGIVEGIYKPVFWNGCKYQGKLWGLISTPSSTALHYNRRLFEENADALRAAGLDPDRAPRTIKEVDAYAKVLDLRDANGRILRTGYLPMEPGWFIEFTPMWFGGNLFDEKTQRFTFTDPKVVKAFQWVKSYADRLGSKSMNDFHSGMGSFSEATNPFMIATVAMEQQGPWMANFIEDLTPKLNRWNWPADKVIKGESVAERRQHSEWAVAPFPSDDGVAPTTYCGFDVLCIPRTAKHKKEAMEFIAYVNRQDVMEKLCSMHCKNSPLAKHSDAFIANHPNPYIDIFEEMAAYPNAHAVPQVALWPEVKVEVTKLAERLYLGEADPAQELAKLQDVMQQKLNTFNKRRALRKARLCGRRICNEPQRSRTVRQRDGVPLAVAVWVYHADGAAHRPLFLLCAFGLLSPPTAHARGCRQLP